MAKDSKFGTFGGVFTPSILTILGVIMYLRLPWVVGSAGLFTSLAIIGVAHVISVSTGLSISSIATDKSVGAGGPYYIVSRSLGLAIGGTLGVALFLGLSFSISLYVIGFTESLLSLLGPLLDIEQGPTAIRVVGTVTLIALTVLTFISTALAIKTQYLILALIAASLLSIFLGAPPELAPTESQLAAPADMPSAALLFGIFFPAVTGFTAGVNMSGDLRNPRKSIPTGTLVAIFAGLAIYVGLAIFLSLRVDRARLVGDPSVLQAIAVFPAAVTAGIWGATLSSALGSILGAPRILQAISSDGITPRVFAKGVGPTKEPRNALLLAFAIAEAGILVAELNVIARVVSMVFLTTYGFLNFSCAIESWASPDFRPDFRIPKSVSVLGALTCVVVMIQLDLLAMVGAVALMAGLFAYLKRLQLRLEAGDTWEGIWSSLVRAGLYRLSRETKQQRNWRPNILMFRTERTRADLSELATQLISGNGMLSDVHLLSKGDDSAPGPIAPDLRVGMFHETRVGTDPYDTIANVCHYHGFGGIRPNSVLLEWATFADDPARFAGLLAALHRDDLNQLVYAEDPDRESVRERRIDVWWRADGGHVALSLGLIRFLTSGTDAAGTAVRFLLISADATNNDVLRTTMRRVLTEARVEATVKLLNDTLDAKPLEHWLEQESADAELTIVGLPDAAEDANTAFFTRMNRLLERMNRVLFVRAGPSFPEVLSVGRAASLSWLPGEPAPEGALRLKVKRPGTPDLALEVEGVESTYQAVLDAFVDQGLDRVTQTHVALLQRLRRAFDDSFAELLALPPDSSKRKLKKLALRTETAFVDSARAALIAFGKEEVEHARGTLDGRVSALIEGAKHGAPARRQLDVNRALQDFEPSADDSPWVRVFKRRKRAWAKLTRKKTVRYRIAHGPLRRHCHDQMMSTVASAALTQFSMDTHQTMMLLGKTLNTMHSHFTGFDLESTADLHARHATATKAFDALIDRLKERAQLNRSTLYRCAEEVLQSYSNDLDRLDASRLSAERKRADPEHATLVASLTALPAAWLANQRWLIGRADLALTMGAFQGHIAGTTEQNLRTMTRALNEGVLAGYQRLHHALAQFAAAILKDGDRAERPVLDAEFPTRFDPASALEALTRETSRLIAQLPGAVETISDESIERLTEGNDEPGEVISLSVRPLVAFLVEADLVTILSEATQRYPSVERQAIAIAQDVVRLVSFQLAEFDAPGEDGASDFAGQMTPVVENGLVRLGVELERLQALPAELEREAEGLLQRLLDTTSAYELASASGNLEQHIRRQRGEKAVSSALALLRRGVERGRTALVRTLYRASAGVVLARRLRSRETDQTSVVDRVLSLVNESEPSQPLLAELPFYYRQLFFGQSAVADTFWVGRESQLRLAERAVANQAHGASGAILIHGSRKSGKTALWQRIVAKVLEGRRVVRVHPVRGGSVDPWVFQKAMGDATESSGAVDEIVATLPSGSVIVFDDLETWWERSPDGFKVIEKIGQLITRHGSNHLFVLCVNTEAFKLINEFVPLPDWALAVLECEPLPAEALKQIITLRHASTGVSFELDGTAEAAISDWTVARLFSEHFNYCGGNIGVALQAWISHIRRAEGTTLSIRAPRAVDLGPLEALKPEWTALLLQLMLHRQLSVERMRRITKLPGAELNHQLDTLGRMRLVDSQRGEVYEINRFVHHLLREHFISQGLFA